MKFFLKLLLCLICLNFFSSCGTQTKSASTTKSTRKELISTLNNSVFCISVIIKGKDEKNRNYENRYSVGTGFLIGENLIASAFHVQTKALELPGKFKTPDSKIVAWKKLESGEVIQFPIEIAAADEKSDLAVYRFDQKIFEANEKFTVFKPLVLAESRPQIGTEVISIGYYAAYEFPFNSIGNVSMIDVNDDIFSDLTLMPGNSGAPICDLENGTVLGVTTDVLDLGNETVRYGISKSATKLRQLLQKL